MKESSPRLLSHQKSNSRYGLVTVVLSLALCLPLSAVVLDDFNDNIKTAWTDTANGGSIVEGGSVFAITSTAAAAALTSSKKTSTAFTTASGHIIEIRVDVNSISPDGNGRAVLGWVPSGALNSSGYSLSVGTSNISIFKAGSSIYSSNLVTSIQSTNLLVVLRMTGSGSSISLRATVYKKGNGSNLLLFEQTVNDGSGVFGSGNAALGALNSPSGPAASVVFDNLKGFDIINSDFTSNFSAARVPLTSVGGGSYLTPDGWIEFHSSTTLVPFTPIQNTNPPGELSVTTFDTAVLYLVGSFYNSRTFKISDGSRLEFQVDITAGSGNPAIIPLISYLPTPSALSTLATYFIGVASGSVVAGKSASTFWYYSVGPSTVKASNVRLIQQMSGEGSAVRIEQRIEDLDVPDVNDPARVIFQTTTVDTSGSYINNNGNFCILVYHDDEAAAGNTCGFDNAVVNQTAPGNTPPLIGNLAPVNGSTFSTNNRVVFTVADDVNTPLNNIVLTLNGVRYTNGTPGVNITPTGSTSTLRTFTLSNLTANVYYTGNVTATDNQGASSTVHYEFDTFSTTNLTVEIEDYNFSTNGSTGGTFIDNPVPSATNDNPNAYYNREGLQDIDFHDNRAGGGTLGAADHVYRPDNPRNYNTGDGPRQKYLDNAASEVQLAADVENGDWVNYTRTFPAGTYNVYIREGNYNMAYMLCALERVTSDPTTNGQTTRLLGHFMQLGGAAGDSGYDVHRLVPLTDVSGNRALVRFAGGVDTVRLRNIFVDFHSDTFQNYMVFIPVADPGTLRPSVALASPIENSTTRMNSMPEGTYASIARRDTTVNVGTVALQINGLAVPSAVVASDGDGGATVTWSLTNVPGTRVITNTVSFTDSDGTNVTYSWTYSYPFLSVTNRHSLPGTNVVARGFAHRTVQDDTADGDSLNRAEQQLAIPPTVPVTIDYATNIQILDWNNESATPQDVPGIPGPGYNFIATEDLAYLELKAGGHRFTVSSDDGFQLRSGRTPSDLGATVIAQSDGDTFGGTFDFVVEADGLYPIRNLWYEQGGSAHFTLSEYNFAASANIVVNDPLDPAGVVKAYLPVSLYSSSTIEGPYTLDPNASFDIGAKTVTVPLAGPAKFYRIYSASTSTITSAVLVGSNIVLRYE